MAGHTGQSSQLSPVTTGRNAQFLATVPTLVGRLASSSTGDNACGNRMTRLHHVVALKVALCLGIEEKADFPNPTFKKVNDQQLFQWFHSTAALNFVSIATCLSRHAG
jgi:hypothetical protein